MDRAVNGGLSRRDWLAVALGGASVGFTQRAGGALRIPRGGTLRLPLPAPRRPVGSTGIIDHMDVWPLALTHETLAQRHADGTFSWPLLALPPVIARDDPRVATLLLRPGMTFADGTSVTALSVLDAWRRLRIFPIGRLALSRFDSLRPFELRGELEFIVRLAVPGTLDEALAAWPFVLVGAAPLRAGTGPFMQRRDDPMALVRNLRCPTGEPFLEAVSFEAPRGRNEEIRAFTTGALDASWWGNSLYEVSRPALVVRGEASVAVGLVPSPDTPFVSASMARTLERVLAPLSQGDSALLRPFGMTPVLPPDAAPDLPALRRTLAGRALRIAHETSDAFLCALAERVLALLDAALVPVRLVAWGEPHDATLRAVAPLGPDPAVALASLLVAAGSDEVGPSAIVRTPSPSRAALAAGVWGRSTVAILGRATPTLHLRADVHGARFDAMGRLELGDAWMGP